MSAETSRPGDSLYRSILAARPKLTTGVPDGLLAETIRLCSSSIIPYIACAREEECIGVACGAALTGERAVVLMQNAGLLNALGAFATMALRYQTPFVILVAHRGGLADPNSYDIEKYNAFEAAMSRITPVFKYAATSFPPDLVPAAFEWAEAARRPAVIALEKSL